MSSASEKLKTLKSELAASLKRPDQVSTPSGIATGLSSLDQYLIWSGFPKGEVSLLISPLGMGATGLCTRSCLSLNGKGLWAAWVFDENSPLCPWPLQQKNFDFSKLLCVSLPKTVRKLLWALQEILSLSLFEMVVCDISNFKLKSHHILKLKQLAKRFKAAIVFIHTTTYQVFNPFYALVLQFHSKNIQVLRAHHRPTPHLLERSQLYADLMPQLTSARKRLSGRELSCVQPASTFS